MVAAAVILDPKRIPKGIDDSKRLTAERREELFEEICATSAFAVAFGSPARIDRDNILRASLWALARAVQALPEQPQACLRRRPRQGRCNLRLRRRDRRRRDRDVDRGGFHHRQGDAGPADVRAGAGLPGLRLRAAQGLCGAGPSGGAGSPRPKRASPPLLRARGRRPTKHFPETIERDLFTVDPTVEAEATRRLEPPVASVACGLYQACGSIEAALRGWFWAFWTHAFHLLVVELIRARPRLVVWIVVLAQAALWLLVPLLIYSSPPGDVATVLAFGREYQVGTDLGPPLAFWLADIAFRAAGNHIFGVYLLAQICAVATFVSLYHLGRAIVGGQQAVLAVLLTMTVMAFLARRSSSARWCWRARSGRCCCCIPGNCSARTGAAPGLPGRSIAACCC